MKKYQAKELLLKYKAKTATEEEIALIDSWILHGADGGIDLNEKELLADLINIRLRLQLDGEQTKTIRLWPRIAAAASILLLLSVGTYILLLPKTPIKQPAQSSITKIAPGGNKATLTLANGQMIVLNDAQLGDLAEQQAAKIKKTAAGNITYTQNSSANKDSVAPVEYNEIATNRGGWYKVTLSDGTQVVLNAASSLRYPTVFNGKVRAVKLQGEAYFEVSKDKKHPFIVTTNKQEVSVLGTHFNINNYDDEPTVNTTLLEGSVKVTNNVTQQSDILKPGQQSVLKGNEMIVHEVDTEEAVSWKNGYFMFKSEAITAIMRKISRWYNVEIIYNGPLPTDKFNGTVERSAEIQEILNNLELTNKVHFKIDGRRVIVTK